MQGQGPPRGADNETVPACISSYSPRAELDFAVGSVLTSEMETGSHHCGDCKSALDQAFSRETRALQG